VTPASQEACAVHFSTMTRALASVLAFIMASCAHMVPPAPLPPQPPQEANPIIIINGRTERLAPRVVQTASPKRRAPVSTAMPDVVAIGWSLRDTLVWDGRAAASGQAVRRVPRRQGVSKSVESNGDARDRSRRGLHYFAAMLCGNWDRGNRVRFPDRSCRWNPDDAGTGRCRAHARTPAVTSGAGARATSVRAGCRGGSALAVVPPRIRR